MNFGNTIPGHSWQEPSAVFGPVLKTLKTLAGHKSIAVSTLASTSVPNGVTAKNKWYETSLPFLMAHKVSMVLIYNVDSSTDFAVLGGKNGASSITIDGQPLNAYSSIATFAKTTSVFVTVNATSSLLLTDSEFQTGSNL